VLSEIKNLEESAYYINFLTRVVKIYPYTYILYNPNPLPPVDPRMPDPYKQDLQRFKDTFSKIWIVYIFKWIVPKAAIGHSLRFETR